MHAPAITLMETARLCLAPNGLQVLQAGLNRALAAARRDVEMNFNEAADFDGKRWINTQSSVFTGDGPHEAEFREMDLESLRFLQAFDILDVHPVHRHWIRFRALPEAAIVHKAEPEFNYEGPDHGEGEPQ